MAKTNETNIQDDDEIELNSDAEEEEELDEEAEVDERKEPSSLADHVDNNKNTIDSENEDDKNETVEYDASKEENEQETAESVQVSSSATSKKSKLQERLRKLQLKINQSKKLNHQQVLQEAERLSSKEAYKKHTKETLKDNVMSKEKEQWSNIYEKNVSTLLERDGNNNNGGKTKKEMKALVQSGSESLRLSHRKMEKNERNLYSSNDYYNPEGQFRNYERSLKSIYSKSDSRNDTTSAPTIGNNDQQEYQRERNGAKRLADEMKRRADKSEKRKQKEMDFEGTDVSYINKRNKHFNEKISRNYDKHTAEIRQNLERGTAL